MKFVFEHDGHVVKEFTFKTDKAIQLITKLSVFGVAVREINRVRPPKRNIGLVFNGIAAAAITDAVMELVLPKKSTSKDEDDTIVDCKDFTEVDQEADKSES